MPDEDRYRYHAYNYGWQRAMLGRSERHEPLDPQGDWHVANMADRAEDYQRKKMGMVPRHKPPMPEDQLTVRPNWRQIRMSDLTQAERELAQAARDETMRRLRSEDPRNAAMVEKIAGDPFGVPMAEEILPP